MGREVTGKQEGSPRMSRHGETDVLAAGCEGGSCECALVSLILPWTQKAKTHPDYRGSGGVRRTMKHEARH